MFVACLELILLYCLSVTTQLLLLRTESANSIEDLEFLFDLFGLFLRYGILDIFLFTALLVNDQSWRGDVPVDRNWSMQRYSKKFLILPCSTTFFL